MNAKEIQALLDAEVRYKDWHFIVSEREVHYQSFPDAPPSVALDLRLRAEWTGIDTVTGKAETQQSRWWPLSEHMCKTEIIQTAFLCVLKAEEHETRELFLYRGKAAFNSHIDIDALAGVSDHVDVRVDTRPNAPTNQRRD